MLRHIQAPYLCVVLGLEEQRDQPGLERLPEECSLLLLLAFIAGKRKKQEM